MTAVTSMEQASTEVLVRLAALVPVAQCLRSCRKAPRFRCRLGFQEFGGWPRLWGSFDSRGCPVQALLERGFPWVTDELWQHPGTDAMFPHSGRQKWWAS